MMKFKTTKKAVLGSNTRVYKLGYCDLSNLLMYHEPIAYTSGVYGWNADIYQIGDTTIVTGYRPFGEQVDYTMVKKYKELARNCLDADPYQYEVNKKDMEELLQAFINELK